MYLDKGNTMMLLYFTFFPKMEIFEKKLPAKLALGRLSRRIAAK